MKLWIRSQNREILIKAQLLDIYNASVEKECYVIEESGTDLGSYKTKARALEVLDEIQGKITQNECLKTMIPKVTDIRGYEEMYGNLFKKMVYEMPLE